MPVTPNGINYPASNAHTRLWEHFQTLATDTDELIAEHARGNADMHLQIYAATTTDTLGRVTLSHSWGRVPNAVLIIPLAPVQAFAVFWGSDSYTASSFRARFQHAGTGGPLDSLTTGPLAAVMFRTK